MKHLFRLFKYGLLSFVLLVVFVFSVDLWVTKSNRNKIFDNTSEIPYNKVGLLLGTSKYLTNGYVNLYYKYRLDAAEELFRSGKIDFILVSGDNHIKSYNEPVKIKNDLISRGIPENKIYLDYAGFRTLDSVVRSREIFGQENITIISQQFHNERALCLAKKKGINAVAYNARDVSRRYGLKVMVREYFARVKMVIDLIIGKNPKFLGEKIEIM